MALPRGGARWPAAAGAVAALVCTFATVPASRVAAAAPRQSGAGKPGAWITLGTTTQAMTPVLYEGPDHRTYVLWAESLGAGKATYDVAVLAPNGAIAMPAASIFGTNYWDGLEDLPTIVAQGPRPLLVFSGGKSAGPYSDGCVVGALGPQIPWVLQNWSLSADCINPIATASETKSGVLSAAWPGGWTNGHGVLYRIGTAATIPGKSPDSEVPVPGTANVARTAEASNTGGNGDVYVSWVQTSSSDATSGYYAKDLSSGSAVQKAPGTGLNSTHMSPFGAVAMASASTHNGVFVAYCSNGPTCSVEVWKIGTKKALTVPGSAGASSIALSSGPGGRLWVAWYTDSKNTVTVARTNESDSLFGADRIYPTPCSDGLVGSSSGNWGRLNVAIQCVTQQNKTIEAAAQAIVPIALTPSRRSVLNGKAQTVSFRVVDVGDPVAGANVTAAGKSAATNANGYAKIPLPKGFQAGNYKVTATAPNYLPAQASLVVKVPPPLKKKSP
jgi:Carboxypeptidase regulatory-like domain